MLQILTFASKQSEMDNRGKRFFFLSENNRAKGPIGEFLNQSKFDAEFGCIYLKSLYFPCTFTYQKYLKTYAVRESINNIKFHSPF